MSHIQRRKGRGYVARYRTPNGSERSKSFKRKVDAERFLTIIEADKMRGAWVDPRLGKTTLASWAEDFAATTTHLRPSTRALAARDPQQGPCTRIVEQIATGSSGWTPAPQSDRPTEAACLPDHITR